MTIGRAGCDAAVSRLFELTGALTPALNAVDLHVDLALGGEQHRGPHLDREVGAVYLMDNCVLRVGDTEVLELVVVEAFPMLDHKMARRARHAGVVGVDREPALRIVGELEFDPVSVT